MRLKRRKVGYITNQELSENLKLDKATIHWHIKRLKENNIVFSEGKSGSVKYFVNPALKVELIRWIN